VRDLFAPAPRVTERFRRRDFGHLDVQITVDDPKTFTNPFTITVTATITITRTARTATATCQRET